MDTNKELCKNCSKVNFCKIREEIHNDNFYVSDCDNFSVKVAESLAQSDEKIQEVYVI